MDITHQTTEFSPVAITENGSYRIRFQDKKAKRHFAAEWRGSEGMFPTGKLSLCFDGDLSIADDVLDLAKGPRAVATKVELPFIDVIVSDLPAGGEVIFHFN